MSAVFDHVQQRAQALALANVQRAGVAALKVELKALKPVDARSRLAALIDDPSDVVGSARVGPLLEAVPKLGPLKALQVARHAGISSVDRKVRDLSPRQRGLIAHVLRSPKVLWPSCVGER